MKKIGILTFYWATNLGAVLQTYALQKYSEKMGFDAEVINFDYSVIAVTLAVFFTPLTFVNPSAMRVVQYFSIFMLILVPKLILAFNKPSRMIANCGCYGVLIGSLLIKLPDYSFVFWS